VSARLINGRRKTGGMLLCKGELLTYTSNIMGKRIDLEKTQILEVLGNGLELILTPQDDNAIALRIGSEDGGRQLGVRQHEDDPNTLVIYLKDSDTGRPRFTVI
jgi:hypothetical protein